MNLLSFDISNCFSYENAHLNLNDQGIVLVTGWSNDENNENGSGKSNLVCKALCWWLYGRTIEGIKTDDVINTHLAPTGRRKKVTAYVEGEFIGVDNEQYTLARQRNPNKLELLHGDDNISGTSTSATQLKVNALLGRDYTTFIQADMFGQGKKSHFFGLTPSEKVKVIKGLLPVQERLEAATAFTKECVLKLNNQLQECINKQEVLSGKGEVLDKEIDRNIILLQDWEKEKEFKTDSLVKRINQEAKRIASIQPELSKAIADLDSICIPDAPLLDERIAEAIKFRDRYTDSLKETKEQLNKAYREEAQLELVANKWKNGFNCPACKQQLPQDQYKVLVVEIQHKEGMLRDLRSRIATHESNRSIVNNKRLG